MNATLLIALSVIGLALIFPLVSPLAVRHFNKKQGIGGDPDSIRRHLLLSGIIVLIWALGFSGISFHEKIGNALAVVLACLCYLSLVSLLFSVRPKFVGFSIGIASSIAFLIAFLFWAFLYSIDDIQYAKAAGPDLHCEVSYFGLAGSSSGMKVKLIKSRFGIDRNVGIAWFVDGQDTPPFTTNEGACLYMLGRYHG